MSRHFIPVISDTIRVHVMLLLGLDALSQLQATINFANDTMKRTNNSWLINLVRKLDQPYIERGP